MKDVRYLPNAITKKKKMLKRRAKENGIYENFGQDEVRELKDKYINISKYTDRMNKAREQLDNFNEWCMTYNG